MFQLELMFNNLAIKKYTLQNGATVWIGRHPENHIVIEDQSVSRLHAIISQEKDTLMIKDTGSSNGIMVNEISVQSTQLHEGDILSIGKNRNLKVSTRVKEKTGLGTDNLTAAFFDPDFDTAALTDK